MVRESLRRGLVFVAHLGRRFNEDGCLLWAGALSYSTLLAVVPLTAVVIAGFSAFPVFDEWSQALQDFIFRTFLPATGESVQGYVNEFAAKASRLSGLGVVALVATALLLVSEIEVALNRIWHVETQRPVASRLMVYWSTLTMGPLLIGASLAITSYLVSLPLIRGAAETGIGHVFLGLVPFVIESVAFTLAYLIVPNTQVPWRAALTGGVLAAGLFEVAKRGFTLYVSQFPTYQVIYGALAAVPIFLLWIFLSWVVILLGASFAASLHTFRPEVALRGWSDRQELQLAYRLVGHLHEAQRHGEGLSARELVALEPAAANAQLARLLTALEQARLVRRLEGGGWLLARDPDELSLLDLYRAGCFALPSPEDLPAQGDDWDTAFRQALLPVDAPVAERLRLPLKGLFRSPGTAVAERAEARENPRMADVDVDRAPATSGR